MNLMSFQSSRISPLVPLGTTHGTMENARLHREEMVDVANEIVDKKMKGGTGIMFEAKHTDSDRIRQNVVTDTQWESLDIYEKFGAHCYVMVSLGLTKFYRVPWATWKKMKELFCHKFMTEQELEPYRLQEKQCTILILEGVELKDENTENGACNKA